MYNFFTIIEFKRYTLKIFELFSIVHQRSFAYTIECSRVSDGLCVFKLHKMRYDILKWTNFVDEKICNVDYNCCHFIW